MKVARKVRSKWNQYRERRHRAIKSMAKGHPDAGTRQRVQIVIALVAQKNVADIASVLQCSQSLAYKTAERFCKQGYEVFADRREENGTSIINRNVERTVKTFVSQTPRRFGRRRPTWTLELLALVLKQRSGIRLSLATMSRLLRRLRIRLGFPKPFVKCPWSKARQHRREQRLRYLLLHAREGEVWVFEDEVDIHLNPKIGRDYMLLGTQKKVQTPGVNKKHYLAGALNAFTGQLTWVESESKNSELFARLIVQLGRAYPLVRRIHLILDNYSIHKSAYTKMIRACCDGKVRFHFLPPYCPDENRIERVWQDLHANVTRNHECRTMSDLMKEVKYWLRKKSKRLQTEYKKRDTSEMYALTS